MDAGKILIYRIPPLFSMYFERIKVLNFLITDNKQLDNL